MADYAWPVSLLEGYGVPVETMVFLDGYVKDDEELRHDFAVLYDEHEMLKTTSAKQDRYIAELEKQLSLLQKTLDLIDKNGGGEDGRC